ncbi:MAG: fumarylacetoacetate hydrolase family protein, partial [Chitinophagaceae bacterium]
MKLVRFGSLGHEKPGIILNGRIYDVSKFGEDYQENFFSFGGLERLREWFHAHQNSCPIQEKEVRLGPPFLRPSKIICIGLNYLKHAQEQSAPIPAEPIVFFKSTTALAGPFDDVVIPKN